MIIGCPVVPVLPRGPNFHVLVLVVVEPLKYMVKKNFMNFVCFGHLKLIHNM